MKSERAGLTPDANEVVVEIEQAFAKAKYPGDGALVYDNSGGHLECNAVAEAFRTKHWKDVPLETIRREGQGLFFLTPEAYRFYLPAYLEAAVTHHREADAAIGSTLFSLELPKRKQDRESYRQRVSGFSAAQLRAIISWLRWMEKRYAADFPLGNIDKALESLEAILKASVSRR